MVLSLAIQDGRNSARMIRIRQESRAPSICIGHAKTLGIVMKHQTKKMEESKGLVRVSRGIESSIYSKVVYVPLDLPIMHPCVISLPLKISEAHYIVENMLTQGVANDIISFQAVQCLFKV